MIEQPSIAGASSDGSSRRRILMLAPTPFFADRGCHVRILEEARALQQRGHRVLIVTYHLGRDIPGIDTVRTPRVPWYRKLSAGPSWHKPYLDIFLYITALRAARRFRPDIIHAHLHEGAFLGIFLKPLLGVPLLFDCQGSLTGELLDHGFMRRDSLLHRFFAGLEGWITRRADVIITSSTPTAELIKQEFPEVAARLIPLPDAVDTDAFAPRSSSTVLADQLGLPVGKRIIAYLGALSVYQGTDLLLQAIRLLQQRRDDFHLLLMGYPDDDYRHRARDLGVDHLITFTGRVDYARASELLSLAEFAVSPKLSATEANGKLLNYMACGLPCVVFDTPVNRELLGESGIYVCSPESGDFAAGIEVLLDDPKTLAERARQVRELAISRHSWAARVAVLERGYAGMQARGNCS